MMAYRFPSIAICFAGLVLLSVPAAAVQLASCDPNFLSCVIPENIVLQLPFTAIAGDVVLTEPNSTTVSDVFRISNNLINTGGGTGLGNMAFLFSTPENTLPAPSTYSANVVFLAADPPATYVGNGTNYLLGYRIGFAQSGSTLGLGQFAMAGLTPSTASALFASGRPPSGWRLPEPGMQSGQMQRPQATMEKKRRDDSEKLSLADARAVIARRRSRTFQGDL
jgi:hypothetical protein